MLYNKKILIILSILSAIFFITTCSPKIDPLKRKHSNPYDPEYTSESTGSGSTNFTIENMVHMDGSMFKFEWTATSESDFAFYQIYISSDRAGTDTNLSARVFDRTTTSAMLGGGYEMDDDAESPITAGGIYWVQFSVHMKSSTADSIQKAVPWSFRALQDVSDDYYNGYAVMSFDHPAVIARQFEPLDYLWDDTLRLHVLVAKSYDNYNVYVMNKYGDPMGPVTMFQFGSFGPIFSSLQTSGLVTDMSNTNAFGDPMTNVPFKPMSIALISNNLYMSAVDYGGVWKANILECSNSFAFDDNDSTLMDLANTATNIIAWIASGYEKPGLASVTGGGRLTSFDDTLYITVQDNGIYILTNEEQFSCTWLGHLMSGYEQYFTPYEIALGPDGSFVGCSLKSDQNISKRRFSAYSPPSGSFSTVWEDLGNGFYNERLMLPSSAAIDDNNNIWFADIHNDEVVLIDKNGNLLSRYGMGGGMEIRFVRKVTMDGKTYIAFVRRTSIDLYDGY
ncbi:hypothetical protein ACFL6D_00210 [Spirochaetota bacterium]